MAETSGCPHKTESLSCTHTDFEARLRLLLQQAAMSHSLQPDCHHIAWGHKSAEGPQGTGFHIL